MQSLLTLIAISLALAVGFQAGIRYQRDGVILDRAAFVSPASNIEAPCFDFCSAWPMIP